MNCPYIEDMQSLLSAKDAEIARLTNDIENWKDEFGKQQDRILELRKEIARLKEDRKRNYDHGPDGDATTPGFFKHKPER